MGCQRSSIKIYDNYLYTEQRLLKKKKKKIKRQKRWKEKSLPEEVVSQGTVIKKGEKTFRNAESLRFYYYYY